MKTSIITALAVFSWSHAVSGVQIPRGGSNQCALRNKKLLNSPELENHDQNIPRNHHRSNCHDHIHHKHIYNHRHVTQEARRSPTGPRPHPQVRGRSMPRLGGLPVRLLVFGGYGTHDDGGAGAHRNIPDDVDGDRHADVDCDIGSGVHRCRKHLHTQR
ncbi:hypothetical protein MGG_08406 [Pyricularia oryzae 70-15]|uniref:Uncharacterized protein n=1 Tax=Pyricularia oryzae (strain 70-15 / ATCC MYA-4617 / FGSC 8958) TaxID=242507 RepID=G4MVX7_PYRO7|nr:uncharacterized protein MGG_08406 [Pyricularia oryzae 70-15]EHA55845.1 hypothetical protein MGG_08406 [Pyricularia oryzae 70-15]